MRLRVLLLLFLLPGLSAMVSAQTDSVRTSLVAKPDTDRVNQLNTLSKEVININADQGIKYATEAKDIATRLNFQSGLAYAHKYIGIGLFNKGEYIEALKQYELSLGVFQSLNDKKGIANMFSNIGNVYYNRGDDDKALELYLQSLKFSEEIKDTMRIVTALSNIGAIYGKKRQTYPLAIKYYRQAYPLSIAINDLYLTGINAVNLGEIFMWENNYDSALHYFNISLSASEGSEDAPYTMNNIGSVYMLQKEYDRAIDIQRQAFELAQKLDSKYDMTVSLVGLAKSYQAEGNLAEAQRCYKQAEVIANETRNNNSLLDIYKGLSKLYTDKNDFANATRYQSLLIDIKDSIYNIETDKKLGTLQFSFDLEKKESQINLLTKDNELQDQIIGRQRLVRNSFIGGFTIMVFSTIVFFRQRNKIRNEKKRSDELLLNILPEETAEELKATGTAKTKSFDLVTVMFTDFKNFTQASERLTAVELVQEINHCYSEFDRIIERHNIEKIKTIGDSYMCAGGLPVENETHAVDVVKAGLEMQRFMAQHKQERIAKGQPYFELRLGIHTGHVVAGIVGIKKFAYDIWGDTVNTASRMESSGETGKVNISEVTYALVKDKFHCIHRGKIQAKNKGEIDMYFVDIEAGDNHLSSGQSFTSQSASLQSGV